MDLSKIEMFNNNAYIKAKYIKEEMKYSNATSISDAILLKIKKTNIMKNYNFSHKGTLTETIYLSEANIKDLYQHTKSNDKKEILKKILKTINDLKIDTQYRRNDSNKTGVSIKSIVDTVDKDGFNQDKWDTLFDIFSKENDIKNVKTQYLTSKRDQHICHSTLKFVQQKYPDLMINLRDIAQDL